MDATATVKIHRRMHARVGLSANRIYSIRFSEDTHKLPSQRYDNVTWIDFNILLLSLFSVA